MKDEFAGTLTERIVVEELSGERTDSGLALGRWIPIAECRARAAPDGTGRKAEGMAFSGMPRLRFLIRTIHVVAVGQRVKWRGRQFMIRQVLEDPRRADRQELGCEEVRV